MSAYKSSLPEKGRRGWYEFTRGGVKGDYFESEGTETEWEILSLGIYLTRKEDQLSI